jgi:3-hydroxybutyryl-CoA dehydratase
MAVDTQATARVEFCITDREMEVFRALSGDTNPLHDDASYARRRGFDGRVVYGGLLVAQVSRLLGAHLPGDGCVWRSLTLRFRSPLYVGEAARLTATVTHANEDLGVMDLKLRIEAGGRTVADGEAATMVARERADVA